MGSRALNELWQSDSTGITDEFLRNNINEWSSSGPRVAIQVANAALDGKPGAMSEIGHFLDQQGFNPFGINPAALGGLAGGKSSSTDTPKVAGPAKTGSATGETTPRWDNAVSRVDGDFGPLNQPVGPKAILTPKDFPEVSAKISQKQNRHTAGTQQLEERGSVGFVNSVSDAQKVLDAYHAGQVKILGKNAQGFPVVKFEGVTGTNVNLGVGITDQPTNVFIIKGTKKPSIVPTNPNWSQK